MSVSRLLLADDHPLIRQGLALAAQTALPGSVIDNAGSVAEAEALIARNGRYRLALLDLVLPDANGFSGFMRLQHALGQVPIVIVTSRDQPQLIETARALGAAGYLLKSQPLDETMASLARILDGETVFPAGGGPAMPEIKDLRARVDSLSGAQLRVLMALASGRLNKQIAGDLNVTEATIKAHLTAIFRKLGVYNRTQAILLLQPLLGELVEEQP